MSYTDEHPSHVIPFIQKRKIFSTLSPPGAAAINNIYRCSLFLSHENVLEHFCEVYHMLVIDR